jgi:peptidoglycan hydrolase-like protein with peptidoglycan-binding domain
MSMAQVRLGLVVFLLLTMSVGANLMLFQSRAGLATAGPALDPLQAKAAAKQRARQLALEVPASSASAAVKPEALASGPVEQTDTTRAIQRELQQRGYLSGAHDGVPGLVTRAAIMAYEHDNGLPITAEPSESLLKRIILGSGATPAPAPGAKGKPGQPEVVIRTVQQSLSAIGYSTGRIDGRLGEETLRAIRDFENDNSLPETGRISAPLVAKLAKLAGSGRLTASR